MHTFLSIVLIIVSVLMIVLVLLQSSKSNGLGAISGGAEQLFGKQKARGFELVLQRITVVVAILFFILTIAVTYFKL
ncbi:preprotein translocase subunit SecG [Bacillus sp. EAC]|uniref:preprotein translocase subunit SecG n=1 Tax=Bacillus sp. EAC TaxID=1978338 RepID=UPI000B44655D|nr:preprotein translocase subunit SecG [Bacillus sp. EAC]